MAADGWRLFLDECVEAPILDALRAKGFDAESARTLERLGRTDESQLALAAMERRLLVTWDTDFVGESRDLLANGDHHCGVLLGLARIEIGGKVRGILKFLDEHSPEDMLDQVRWISHR